MKPAWMSSTTDRMEKQFPVHSMTHRLFLAPVVRICLSGYLLRHEIGPTGAPRELRSSIISRKTGLAWKVKQKSLADKALEVRSDPPPPAKNTLSSNDSSILVI